MTIDARHGFRRIGEVCPGNFGGEIYDRNHQLIGKKVYLCIWS